jgi:predicted component of type VI protein secretion system
MALKLTVLSEQSAVLGARQSIVMGVGGGSIGRAHDNDWVLPDPDRYLSAHHARVKFRDGAYVLFDTSSNGVFINERNEPLGRRASYTLRNGDLLRLGSYQIAVALDPEASDAPEASAVFPVNQAAAADAAALVRNDLGSDFSMGDLLRQELTASGSLGTITEDPALLAFDQSERVRAPGRAPAAGAARPELRATDNAAGVDALCRGAGIDAGAFPPETHARLLHLAGLMLREALVGLKGLALAQRDMRDQQHITVGREDPQRIGLAGLPVEDLLMRLLQGHAAHQLDAVQWLRETLASTRRHDQAAARAMRTALTEFLLRLDPKALAAAAAPGSAAEAQLAMLRERFQSITGMTAGELPHLFSEVFARAFATEFKSGG